MEIAFLPPWLLVRFIPDQESRLHWNILLSQLLLLGFVASPLIDLSSQLPHFCLVKRCLSIPCPGCGMTTSVRHLSCGDWEASVSANFAGVALVAGLAMQCVLHGLAVVIQPTRRGCRKISTTISCFVIAMIAVSWTMRLADFVN